MNDFIGILPAADLGNRLSPLRYSKELLPVFFVANENERETQPRVVIEYSLTAMKFAEIQSCLIAISERKTEIVRYLGDGSELGLHIADLHQCKHSDLTYSIKLGVPWFGENYICLALPDTIFYPFNAISIVCQETIARQSDVMLGVFPTPKPEQLGPVRIDSEGTVSEVLEKPRNPDIYNPWGMATWTPQFSQSFDRVVRSNPTIGDRSIGDIFNLAIAQGLKVDAVFFANGKYLDLGTPEGLRTMSLDRNPLNLEA